MLSVNSQIHRSPFILAEPDLVFRGHSLDRPNGAEVKTLFREYLYSSLQIGSAGPHFDDGFKDVFSLCKIKKCMFKTVICFLSSTFKILPIT